jgi:hypothetical protein
MENVDVGFRILSARPVLTGISNGASLENLICDAIPDGTLVWVIAEQTPYYFSKFSTAAVSAPAVIATGRGAGVAGRWFRFQGGGATGATGTTGPTGSTGPTGPAEDAGFYWGASGAVDGTFLLPYEPPQGDTGTPSPTGTYIVVPRTGTLGLALAYDNNTLTDRTFTLTLNGVDTTVVVTIANGNNLGENNVNTVAVTRGQLLRVRANGTAASNNMQFGVQYV